MVVIAPTLVAQRYGPEEYHKFNYFANPVRDPTGNPVLVWRHGGGGTIGSFASVSNGSIEWPILQFFLLNSLPVHFDIISASSAQQVMTGSNQIRRSVRKHMLDNIVDYKRMICALKAWGTGALGQSTFMLDPNRFVAGGDSFGATLTALSMITPSITFPTAWDHGLTTLYEPNQFNSVVNGVIFHRGQVDFRTRTLVNPGGSPASMNFLDFTAVDGIFGSRVDDAGAEWTLVPTQFKEAVSLIAYLERGYTQYYRPMFVTYSDDPAFLGTHPLLDNHDKRMRIYLLEALRAAGVDYMDGGLNPVGPPEGGLNFSPPPAVQRAIYDWCVYCNDKANTPTWQET